MSWRGAGPFLFDGAAVEVGFLPVESVSTGNTGSVSATLEALTLSSTGVITIEGTLNKTLGSLVSTGSAGLSITGSLTATLESVTLTSASTLTIAGVVNTTLGELTLSAAGTVSGGSITGQVNATLGALTLVATGELTGEEQYGGSHYSRYGGSEYGRRRQEYIDRTTKKEDPVVEETIEVSVEEIAVIQPVNREVERLKQTIKESLRAEEIYQAKVRQNNDALALLLLV